jgi:dihydropyrimidinase
VVIRGGTVWSPDGSQQADVVVEGGRIATIAPVAEVHAGDEVLDAAGLHVVPGFIDMHVHVADRIGPYELADDLASGTEVAVRNGITSVFTFATQREGETVEGAVGRYAARAHGACYCDVGLHLTPTAWPWDWEAVGRLAAAGVRTVKLYTTYRDAGLHTPWDRLAEVMARLAALDLGLLLHCEDDAVLAAAPPPPDPRDPFSHTVARPAAAEVEAIRHACELAVETGCRLHVVHVSTAKGANTVAAARRRGARVTCETCPQYLLLDDALLGGPGGHRLLCTPPLRDAATRRCLEERLVAGEIDLLATDHCAFRRGDKDAWSGADYRAVPNGLAGLGALVPLAWELLVRRHGRGVGELVRRLAETPARVAGVYPRKGALVPGADADIAVLDDRAAARPVASTLADAHDPWSGHATTLLARHVLVRGRPVVGDGKLLAGATPAGALFPWGQSL